MLNFFSGYFTGTLENLIPQTPVRMGAWFSFSKEERPPEHCSTWEKYSIQPRKVGQQETEPSQNSGDTEIANPKNSLKVLGDFLNFLVLGQSRMVCRYLYRHKRAQSHIGCWLCWKGLMWYILIHLGRVSKAWLWSAMTLGHFTLIYRIFSLQRSLPSPSFSYISPILTYSQKVGWMWK